MNPTNQSPATSTYSARQQRILRLPEVKAKTGFGRSTIYAPVYKKRGANGEFPLSIRIGAFALLPSQNEPSETDLSQTKSS